MVSPFLIFIRALLISGLAYFFYGRSKMRVMNTISAHASKELVLGLLRALNDHDYREARNYLHPDFRFKGLPGPGEGAENYLADMEKLQLEYSIRKVFAEGNDVCVLYDLIFRDKLIFCCGWYQLGNGKISRLREIFDSAPLLQKSRARESD